MSDGPDTGPLKIGETFLEKYQILGVLGRGGFGCVYRAMNLFMGREVALKVLDRSGGLTEEMRHRGQTEAALLGRLEHENLVRVFDAGISESGHLYLVMELLRGKTLAEHLRTDGAFSIEEGLRLTESICEGLGCAHDIYAVHRDLKPANIFITEAGVPKILDFGVAKIAGASGYKTAQNLVVGTSMYISPEQIQGQVATARSDLYALGLIAFEMFCGTHPILLADPPLNLHDRRSIVWWQVKGRPPLLDQINPAIPSYVARLVNTAIAKRPGQRFESARNMAERAAQYRLRYSADLRQDESTNRQSRAMEGYRKYPDRPPGAFLDAASGFPPSPRASASHSTAPHGTARAAEALPLPNSTETNHVLEMSRSRVPRERSPREVFPPPRQNGASASIEPSSEAFPPTRSGGATIRMRRDNAVAVVPNVTSVRDELGADAGTRSQSLPPTQTLPPLVGTPPPTVSSLPSMGLPSAGPPSRMGLRLPLRKEWMMLASGALAGALIAAMVYLFRLPARVNTDEIRIEPAPMASRAEITDPSELAVPLPSAPAPAAPAPPPSAVATGESLTPIPSMEPEPRALELEGVPAVVSQTEPRSSTLDADRYSGQVIAAPRPRPKPTAKAQIRKAPAADPKSTLSDFPSSGLWVEREPKPSTSSKKSKPPVEREIW